MDVRQKVITVFIVAVVVIAALVVGMRLDDKEDSGVVNSDIVVLQDGMTVFEDASELPDEFTITFDLTTVFTGWDGDELVLGVDPRDGPVTIGYKVGLSWTEASQYFVDVYTEKEESGWDTAVSCGSEDVTDDVYNRWVRTEGSEGDVSYDVKIVVDEPVSRLYCRSPIEPRLGDLTGQEFGYRIVGQNADGLLSGEMTLTYGESDDGSDYIVGMTYSVTTATNTELTGEDTLQMPKDDPWNGGVFDGGWDIYTYWGEKHLDVMFTEGEDSFLDRYVSDGILYESVYSMDDVLAIVMLDSAEVLGERTLSPTEYTYTAEIDGDDITTKQDITGSASYERLDSTGTYALMRSYNLIIIGDDVWVDQEVTRWEPLSDDIPGERQGTMYLDTVWGRIEVDIFTEFFDGEDHSANYYSYKGAIPVKWTYLLANDDWIILNYNVVSYTFEGEVYKSLDKLLPHAMEW